MGSICFATVMAALTPAAHANINIVSDTNVTPSSPIVAGTDTLTVSNNGASPTLNIVGGTVINGTANIGFNGGGAVNISSGTWSSSQSIYFGNNGAGNLAMSGGIITDYGVFLGVWGGTSTATVTGGTWTTYSGGTVGLFILGNSGTATLNLAGGTVNTSTMLIANNAGSKGVLNLGTGGTAGTINADNIAGCNGAATVNFNHTGDYTLASNLVGKLTVNKLGSGTTTLTGTSNYNGDTTIDGGGLVVTGSLSTHTLYAGESGTGSLNINGGSVSDLYGIIGHQIGSVGRVTVTGGTWANSDALYVGYNGTGTLNITGGSVNDPIACIGLLPGTNGTVTVTGGTWTNNAGLYIGESGTGTLNLSDSGVVNVPSDTGALYLARYGGSVGTLNLGTGGTAGTLQATVLGGLGTAVVNFNHTGDYTFASNLIGNLTVNKLGSGTTTLTGTRNYYGDTLIDGGGFVVTGALSTTSLYVGNSGTGTLDINGGSVNVASGTGTLYLARNGGSVGTLNLGTGGTAGKLQATVLGGLGTAVVNFNHTGDYTFASNLIGNLTVNKLGSGTTTLTGTSNYNGDTTIDGGGLVVTGALSTLTLYAGESGTGSLSINGGSVSDIYGIVGHQDGSNGTVAVVGGTWTNIDALYVGYNGTGTLNITGGSVNDPIACIGLLPGTNGTVTVTGGTWSNNAGLYIGEYGAGTLNLSDSGVVSVGSGTGTLYLGLYEGSVGTLNLGTGGTAGTLQAAVVTGGSGTAVVNFNHTGDYTFASNLIGNLTVNKLGSGTTTLTGTSNYNGDTLIDGGGFVVTGALSTLTLYAGESGTGSLSINGGSMSDIYGIIGHQDGSVGRVTVTGGTWTNIGALYVGYNGSGTLNIKGGLVTNDIACIGLLPGTNGTVTVTGGTWSNNAGLYIGEYGAGTLNLGDSGVVSVGGGTGVLYLGLQKGSVGTLNLGTGGTAGTLQAAVVTGGSGTAVVNFNHTDAYTFASKLTGNLSVNQISGTTNLTGTSNYTGATTVAGGALLINGAVTTGSMAVLNGGLLGGGGTIYGNVFNSGVVSPGNSPGTLTIGGNYTQSSSGVLLIQVESLTNYDHLAVTGTAALSGKLQVDFQGSYTPVYGDVFSFLTAALVTGTFSEIDTNRLIKLRADYLSSSASFSLKAIQGRVADVPGLTPNQHAVASGLDSVVNDPRVSKLFTYLDSLNLAEIPQKIEKIVPTNLIPMFDASIASAQTQALNLERRMGEIQSGAAGFSGNGLHLSDSHGTRSSNGTPDGKQVIDKNGKALEPAPLDERWGFFINGSGEFVDEESTATAHGMNFSTGGITTGADYRLGDHAAVGITAGYANTSAEGQVKIDSGKLGLYGTLFGDGFFLNGVVGGGLNSYDTHRATLGGDASGDTNGADINALLGTGYTYRKGGFSIGPVASARYCWVGLDHFVEHGSLAPLSINEQSEASLKSTAGFQSSYAFQVGKTVVTPQVRAQWLHEYLDASRGIGASFLPGGAFTVYGPDAGRDSLQLDVGTTLQFTPTVGVYVFYTGDLARKNYTSHAINGGVQLSF